MLVLSRAPQEAVVIGKPSGELLTVTVLQIEPETVELSLRPEGSEVEGLTVVRVKLKEWADIWDGVRLLYLRCREVTTAADTHLEARLGVVAPKEYAVHRKEVYDAVFVAGSMKTATESPPGRLERKRFTPTYVRYDARQTYDRFTDRARKVMQLANQEAQRFNHEYIGTEHILLGLIKEGSGVAANVLKNLNVDLRRIRIEVEKIVMSGPDMVTMGKLPQTPRAKKVIEYALEEARNLKHNYVGTEHLLLGLAREQEGVAAQVLMNLGIHLDDLREEVLNLLGHPAPPDLLNATATLAQMARIENLPSPFQEEIRGIDAKIDWLLLEKESAVAAMDFETAARKRDEADKLKKRRQETLERAELAQKNQGRTIEYELLVSAQSPDGTPVESSKVAFIKERFTLKFGGFACSQQQVAGPWKIGAATFNGEVLSFRVITHDNDETRAFFTHLKDEIQRELNIDNVAILRRRIDIV